MTLSITILSITTFSITTNILECHCSSVGKREKMNFKITCSIPSLAKLLSTLGIAMLSITTLSIKYGYFRYCYAECRYADRPGLSKRVDRILIVWKKATGTKCV
jgi:hypothetical protein